MRTSMSGAAWRSISRARSSAGTPRPAISRWQPSAASDWATARPMPLLAPVTSARFPFSFKSIGILLERVLVPALRGYQNCPTLDDRALFYQDLRVERGHARAPHPL